MKRLGKRMLSNLVAWLMCFSVVACLNEDDPNDETLVADTFIGVAGVDDLSGAVREARIIGAFEKAKSTVGAKNWMRRNLQTGLSEKFGPLKLSKQKDTDHIVASAATRTFLDAGQMYFGPANQSSLVEIEKDNDHIYYSTFEPELASGLYQIKFMGSPNINAFADLISMPESLQNVTVEGMALADRTVVIHRENGFTIEWDPPSMMHDNNVILMELVGITPQGEKVRLQGGNYEREYVMAGSDKHQWVVDAKDIADFPLSIEYPAQLYFSRAHLYQSTHETLTLNSEGVRTVANYASIE